MVRLKIKEIAKAKGFSQRKLFLRSGVDIKTIQKIYKNPYAVITTETLGKIAEVLGVDASELIESDENNEEKNKAEYEKWKKEQRNIQESTNE
jgi:transcriptional regulator with XRE-family HTH domain